MSEFTKLALKFIELLLYFIKLIPEFINLLSYFTILPMKFIIQTKTPAPQEKAHLQSASPTTKPKPAKELFLSLFFPPPKKNKFSTAIPPYFQTNLIKITAYNIGFAKERVKCKIQRQ